MAVNHTLVIGFGNPIRSDDGAGIWIAEQLAALHLPGVVVESCHQLSLDLLEEFHAFARLLFIDAAADGEPLRLARVGAPGVAIPPSAHHLTPADLLGMYATLYGQMREALLLTVRGENFEFGTTLSPKVQTEATRAVTLLTDLLSTNDGGLTTNHAAWATDLCRPTPPRADVSRKR